ncbi:unnamed protein product [Protopolystoma xenopodis]|uniref:Peptidase M12B domain-containing protein n=1 Tax=Protopolystoma xenopodis TaxID=117903 RepID=A0A448WWP1_9PLAT|nr:unnamed protein product [Protopolystoma xenopodis]
MLSIFFLFQYKSKIFNSVRLLFPFPVPQKQGVTLQLNTGWTTYMSYDGQQLLHAAAELIAAHELGHSWGADHDPDSTECSPIASGRGKFLMYTYSVSGYASNNDVRLELSF